MASPELAKSYPTSPEAAERARAEYWNHRLDSVAHTLRGNGFEVVRAHDRIEAFEEVLRLIPEGALVAFGGSMSVQALEIVDALAKRNQPVADPYVPGLSAEERFERRRQGLLADVFLTGTNALTDDGVLINLDGIGNRVAAMICGPRKVILVIGRNKLFADEAAARLHVRQVAAVMNNARLETKNPCRVDGVCHDCASPTRICNVMTMMLRCNPPGRITIVLVNEELGF